MRRGVMMVGWSENMKGLSDDQEEPNDPDKLGNAGPDWR